MRAVASLFIAATLLALPLCADDKVASGTSQKSLAEQLYGTIPEINHALELNPKDDKAWLDRGLVKDSKGDLDGAMADYNRVIALKPKDPEAYKLRGDIKEKRRQFDEAIADFDIAINLDPKSPDAFFSRGVLKREKGDFDGAVADFGRTIDFNSKGAAGGNANYQWQLRSYAYYAAFARGNIERSKGNMKSALADFDLAVSLDPKNARAYETRAEIKKALGDSDGSAADLKQASQLKQDSH